VTIRRLEKEAKQQLVKTYLEELHKSFEDDVMSMLVEAEQTDNPLFLRMAIDELVTMAVFETVKQTVTHILMQDSPLDLCVMMLQRYEQDSGQQLVHNAFTCIYICRNGISEKALQSILDVPLDEWSPFYHTVRPSLAVHGELLSIANFVMASAIHTRYIASIDLREWSQESKIMLAHRDVKPENLQLHVKGPVTLVAIRFVKDGNGSGLAYKSAPKGGAAGSKADGKSKGGR